jgi:phosphosulfolactate synthase (CoM biosynthesis protein A)
MATKKIGITVDDWKVKHFEKELKERGFETVEVTSLSALASGTSLLAVYCTEEEYTAKKEVVRRVCVKMETTLKRMN